MLLPEDWSVIVGDGDGTQPAIRPDLELLQGERVANDEDMTQRVARRSLEDEVADLRRRLDKKDDDLREARKQLDKAVHDRDGDLRRERERNEKLTDYIFTRFDVKL